MKVWHLLVAGAAVALLVPIGYVQMTKGTVSAYVTTKDRDAGHKYVYVDGPPGMFYNDDSWFAWKRNSGTVHGQIPEQAQCTFVVYGTRIEFLSIAPNILTARCERP